MLNVALRQARRHLVLRLLYLPGRGSGDGSGRSRLDQVAHHLPLDLFQRHRPVSGLSGAGRSLHAVRALVESRGRKARVGTSICGPGFRFDLLQGLVSRSRIGSLLSDDVQGAVRRGRVSTRVERRGRRDVPARGLLLTKTRGCEGKVDDMLIESFWVSYRPRPRPRTYTSWAHRKSRPRYWQTDRTQAW
jgi:hypothetical protein